MESLRKLLWSPQRVQPIFPDDEIYPVHPFDETKSFQEIVLSWTMRFNDVLDADKLHSSLARLLKMGDWRKLGGRLRRREDGRLEIHVPRVFTAERPAVAFTHNLFDMSIEEHPLAKRLPKATDHGCIQASASEFREFGARPNVPAVLDDFLYQDIPQLSLHVTSFSDATLVAISYPHTLMDAMGQLALTKAWSRMVAGRNSEVSPVYGSHEDVMTIAADHPAGKEHEQEDWRLAGKLLRGFHLFVFVINFICDLLRDRVIESRTIFLPRNVVAQMCHRAQEEIAANAGPDDKKPFISEGDVLIGWATQAIVSSEPRRRPVTVWTALNMRFWIPSIVQTGGVYIQNLAMVAFTFLSPEAARAPIGEIALSHRNHLIEQTTEPQLRAMLRARRDLFEAGNKDGTLLCGEPTMMLLVFTNWTKAKFITAADFSGAVVRQGEDSKTRKNALGTMIYHHSQALTENTTTRNVIGIVGKDHEDNYWLIGYLSPRQWAKIEESLKTMR